MLNAAANPDAGIAVLSAAVSWSPVTEPVLAASAAVNHLPAAAFNSSRVTTPSLSASAAKNTSVAERNVSRVALVPSDGAPLPC